MAAPGDAPADREVERRLIERVLGRDEAAFRALYRLHTPRLHLLALRLTGGSDADAQDVIQEAWRRAIGALAGFEGRSSLHTWLSAIVTRCALEERRSVRRHAGPTPLGGGGSRADTRTHGSQAPPFRDRNGHAVASGRIDLERAFEKLAPGFRAVLVLHDLEGLRHEDIADRLGIAPGTSKSQLSRARARMRELLGEDYAT